LIIHDIVNNIANSPKYTIDPYAIRPIEK